MSVDGGRPTSADSGASATTADFFGMFKIIGRRWPTARYPRWQRTTSCDVGRCRGGDVRWLQDVGRHNPHSRPTSVDGLNRARLPATDARGCPLPRSIPRARRLTTLRSIAPVCSPVSSRPLTLPASPITTFTAFLSRPRVLPPACTYLKLQGRHTYTVVPCHHGPKGQKNAEKVC